MMTDLYNWQIFYGFLYIVPIVIFSVLYNIPKFFEVHFHLFIKANLGTFCHPSFFDNLCESVCFLHQFAFKFSTTQNHRCCITSSGHISISNLFDLPSPFPFPSPLSSWSFYNRLFKSPTCFFLTLLHFQFYLYFHPPFEISGQVQNLWSFFFIFF